MGGPGRDGVPGRQLRSQLTHGEVRQIGLSVHGKVVQGVGPLVDGVAEESVGERVHRRVGGRRRETGSLSEETVMKQMLLGRVGLWASVGLLALMVIPTAVGADAVSLNVDMLCVTSGTPLGAPFLAGHGKVSAAGDLMVQLMGVRPSVSWRCEANCLVLESLTFGLSTHVDNCGVSNRQGVLQVKVPGFFAPLFQARNGVCVVPLLSLSPESGPGMACFNGFGDVE